MKGLNVLLGAAVLAAGFTSCKSETETVAEKSIDRYVVYVDSIKGLDAAERTKNWEAIDTEYERRLAEADAAIADMKDNEEVRTRIETSKTTYATFKTEAPAAAVPAGTAGDAAMAGASAYATPKALFGNADTSFVWVNKDNILATYKMFYDTFSKNADNYTEAEFKQLKAWYEALDERKNTVEKEGLSGDDNREIAGLKAKFAPKFKWERMTADGPED